MRQLDLLEQPRPKGLRRFRALSLWEPWATLVRVQAKRIETRDWWTSHRGPLLIQASRRWTREQREFLAEREVQLALAPALGVEIVTERHLHLGCAICVVDLVECRRMTDAWIATVPPHELDFGDYYPDRYAWILAGVRPVRPFPVQGAQGIFGVSADIADLGIEGDRLR